MILCSYIRRSFGSGYLTPGLLQRNIITATELVVSNLCVQGGAN